MGTTSAPPPQAGARAGRAELAWTLACALLVALPYLWGLDNGFAWLDHSEILEGGLIVRSPGEALALLGNDRNFAGYHRPLYNLAHSLDLALWGPRPFGFHLSSVALHALNAALVFRIARRLGWSVLASGALAVLWGLHPVNAEAAGLIHAKADLLVVALLLGAFAWSLPPPPGGGPRGWRRGLSLALFAAAAQAKELAFVFPPAMSLWWWARRGRDPSPPGRYVAALWGIAALASGHRFFAAPPASYDSSLDLGERLLTFGSVYLAYLRKLLLPTDLYISDATLRFTAPEASPLRILATLVVVLVFLALLWIREPRTRPWIVLFHLALAPVAQIVPLLHFQAERYLYLPSLAFVGAWIQGVLPSHGTPTRWRLAAAVGLLAVLAGLFASVDLRRVATFSDDLALFTPEVQRDPHYSEGLSMLARAHERAGRLELAEALYRAALQPRPHVVAYLDLDGTVVNLAANLLLQHREREVGSLVEAHLPRMRSARHREEALYNLAVADFRLERYEQALPVLASYLGRHPADAVCAYLAGMAAHRLGERELAAGYLRHHLRLRPQGPRAGEVRAILDELEPPAAQ